MNDKSMPDEIWLFTGNNNATKQLADEPDDDIKDLHTQYTRTQAIVELLEGMFPNFDGASESPDCCCVNCRYLLGRKDTLNDAIQAIKDMK